MPTGQMPSETIPRPDRGAIRKSPRGRHFRLSCHFFPGIRDDRGPSPHYLGRRVLREARSAMNPGKIGEAGRQLEALWTSGTLTGLSDSQLLWQYVHARGRDAVAEAAFRELGNRHGPMVLAVCRQLLRRPQDVDDAFQATFLVLVRQARSLRVDESLAPWLWSVASRTARRARD